MWLTVGHDRALNMLKQGLKDGRLSHAYLFAGPRQVGKLTLAIDLARAVNCDGEDRPCGECGQCRRIESSLHADVHIVGVQPETPANGRSRIAIGIDQVREVQRQASLKPYEGRCRVFIIDGAERLSEEAANCLLKVLEEPPDQVILVLLACDADAILPTVVSRCHRIGLRSLPVVLVAGELAARFGTERNEAMEIARLSGGRIGWALRMAAEPELLRSQMERLEALEKSVGASLVQRFSDAGALAANRSRESLSQELELWQEWWRDVMMIKAGVSEFVTNLSRMDALEATAAAYSSRQIAAALKAILDTSDYIGRNANPRLALEALMLRLP